MSPSVNETVNLDPLMIGGRMAHGTVAICLFIRPPRRTNKTPHVQFGQKELKEKEEENCGAHRRTADDQLLID